ncbi:hypothetical protein M409DRAFT_60806 [Zasmidium cellare ATCC 36951]|uniref:Uncharacterized protein n=1 Tax=Zasmidium cellare ATCC 36951 TaxID=1080233 RepID=A0A6A6BZZ0_ZASCE|nr:uncharacterized protein M409DRAFT_60806 [Zasmidium cellare ATCC 36951]KAF2159460.1 hypothetical protein M409DRAFT_60806 [Zasmidium cellare ATCC 36951]
MFSKAITTSRLASCATFLLALGAKGAFGDTAIDNDTFQNDPAGAAIQAAPLWFLPTSTCFRSPAEVNGEQTNGNDPDNCNINKIDNNCPQQPDWQGAYTKANSFPTYYYVKYCGDLDQWRILYDVYFTKDTGHKSDWEWAVINNGNGGYNRDSVIMEQEGNHGYSAWSSIPEAFIDNIYNNDGSNGNHAKLYVAKWHHSIQTSPNSSFKSTCPPGFKDDFRANDYYWVASDNLVSDDVIDPSWVWGKADSFPASFHDGGAHDICRNL